MSINIAGKKILTDYHSVLFKLSGVITDFVTEAGEVLNLCPPEHFNPICNLIRETECGNKKCKLSDQAFHKCRDSGKSMVYKCHAGFIDIIVPLYVNKQFIGCLTSGQILETKPTEESFQRFRKKTKYLKSNEKILRKHYFATKVLTREQIDALVELLTLVGNYIVESENRIIFLESASEKSRISLARQFIEKHYGQKITVADIARSVYQSESYFSHQFKEEVGVSVIQYLNRFRIEKAKDLLADSSLSITDIALKTGFQNLTHFNRIFKKLEQISPGKYQKSRKGKK